LRRTPAEDTTDPVAVAAPGIQLKLEAALQTLESMDEDASWIVTGPAGPPFPLAAVSSSEIVRPSVGIGVRLLSELSGAALS
jgi:hypothetical protein